MPCFCFCSQHFGYETSQTVLGRCLTSYKCKSILITRFYIFVYMQIKSHYGLVMSMRPPARISVFNRPTDMDQIYRNGSLGYGDLANPIPKYHLSIWLQLPLILLLTGSISTFAFPFFFLPPSPFFSWFGYIKHE